ncbi:hypothetical protein CASFOL_039187 [Castilleja foliolosa]|uniref:Uncharacterized protein n=1 Tax=Castilleja foliolosa TaxID=1961234 RepID=A0ABD3BHA0_9LAMI
MSTETTLNKVQRSSLFLAYVVNVIGPVLVIKYIAIVANVSARIGSIGGNRLGGWH